MLPITSTKKLICAIARHRWIHRISDAVPARDAHLAYTPRFETPQTENLTGTQFAYVPYSTTRQPAQPWRGPSRM